MQTIKKPLISVLMGVYDELETYVVEAIDSILNQTYENLELIIVLDKPDNTELKKLLDGYTKEDDRVKVIVNSKNLGLAESLNKAFTHATGEVIARMDADDVSDSNRLEIELQTLLNNDVDVLTSNARFIDDKGSFVGHHNFIPENPHAFNELLPIANSIIHPSVLLKRHVLEDLKYRNVPCEDYDLWLRVIDNNYKISGINKELMSYRVRVDGATNSRPLRMHLASEYVRRLHIDRIVNNQDFYNEISFNDYLKECRYNSSSEQKFFNAMTTKNKYLKFLKLLFAPYGVSFLANQKDFDRRLKYCKDLI